MIAQGAYSYALVVLLLVTSVPQGSLGAETQPRCANKEAPGQSEGSCDVSEEDGTNLLQTHAAISRHSADEEATGQADQAHDEASTQEKLMTRQRHTVADRMFSKADVDGDGLLSMSELNNMASHFTSKYPILKETDWHSYDENADGLLSQTELDGARKMISAAQALRTKAMLKAHLADKQVASSTSTEDGEHSLVPEQDAGKDDELSLEQEFEASLISKKTQATCQHEGKTYPFLKCIETQPNHMATCCEQDYWRPSWRCVVEKGVPSEDCHHCAGC